MDERTGVAHQRGAVSEWMAVALHNLLDADGAPPAAGEPLPVLWHWLAFRSAAPQAGIGGDGHPLIDDVIGRPPPGRRMFVGSRVVARAPVRVGDEIDRHCEVVATREKMGRSGRLTFLEVAMEYAVAGRRCITETQTIVYRHDQVGRSSAARAPIGSEGSWDWVRERSMDSTLLFRFSALTYNAHRIHYDLPYATEVEGYPGLVVHGPLQALLLTEEVRARLPQRPIERIEFRSLAPAFAGQALSIAGARSGTALRLAVFDADGSVTTTASAAIGS